MLSGNFPTVTASTLGTLTSFALFGAIATHSAQAAVLTYTSNLTVTATGNPVLIASGFLTYTKTSNEPSVPPLLAM
jgi:hypothetical protein